MTQWLKKQGGKVVIQNHSHYQHILENFATNDDYITASNRDPSKTFTLAHNQFSHMDRAEFNEFRHADANRQYYQSHAKGTSLLEIHGHGPDSSSSGNGRQRSLMELPDSVDWLQVPGVVTPVKEQGICAACYAFAALGDV